MDDSYHDQRAQEDPVVHTIVPKCFSHPTLSVTATSLVGTTYNKIYHLKRLRKTTRGDIADVLNDLQLIEDSANDQPVSTGRPPDVSNGLDDVDDDDDDNDDDDDVDEISEVQKHTWAAKTCFRHRKKLLRIDPNVLNEAETFIEEWLVELTQTPIPFLGHRKSLDDLCMLLYAAIHDEMYRQEPQPAQECQATQYSVEFVTFLCLAGGRPAKSVPSRIFDDQTSLEDVLDEVVVEHEMVRDMPRWQRGDMGLDSNDAPWDGWHFQCAAGIGDLDMASTSWTLLDSDTFDDLKHGARSARCFIMHKVQIEISSNIKAKQRHLYDNPRRGCWTWALWKTNEQEKASEVPFVPTDFMPAFDPNGLTVKDMKQKQSVKVRKQMPPKRTPEEQAAKHGMAVRTKKRKRAG